MKIPIFSGHFSKATQFTIWSGLFFILLLIGLSLLSAHVTHSRQINFWQKQLDSIVLSISLQNTRSIESANLVLDSIADLVNREDIQDETDYRNKLSSERIFDIIRNRKLSLEQVDVISIVAKNGDNINYTRGYPVPSINLSERDYFKYHQSNRNLATWVSQPVRNKGNNQWTFYLTRRINDKRGEFVGLVLVGISIDNLSSFYEKIAQNLGDGTTISLYRNDLTLIAEYPKDEEKIGKVGSEWGGGLSPMPVVL